MNGSRSTPRLASAFATFTRPIYPFRYCKGLYRASRALMPEREALLTRNRNHNVQNLADLLNPPLISLVNFSSEEGTYYKGVVHI